jgi:hypothetical protein
VFDLLPELLIAGSFRTYLTAHLLDQKVVQVANDSILTARHRYRRSGHLVGRTKSATLWRLPEHVVPS